MRYGGTYVRVISYGGRAVTNVRMGGIPVCVDDERMLPEEVKDEMGY